jgi:nucleotide-binding universal stress UspA family protein
MHIRNILVPVDFSTPSRLAVSHGITFARRFHARLTLLNVTDLPATVLYAQPATSEKIEREHREQTSRMMSSLVDPKDQADLDLQIRVKTGNIEEEIYSSISEEKADVLVMGTHGRGIVARAFIGSVTQHILRKVPVPVLTVCRVSRPLTFDRILFATDLSDASRRGFELVLELAGVTGSNVSVIHSVDVPGIAAGAGTVSDRRELLEDAGLRLNELADEGRRQEVNIDTVLAESTPAEAIFKAAADADLIVITIERKGLLERALLGSTAERVIREAHLPVLSIPVGTNEEPEKGPSAASNDLQT